MGRFWIFKAALAAALLCAPDIAMADPLFGGAAQSADFQLFPFWNKVLVDMANETVPAAVGGLQPIAFTGNSAVPAAAAGTAPCQDERHCIPQAWTDFLATLKNLDPQAQMEAVNHWANAKPYVEDLANWGLPDYWETPGEFIAHGGDCEDYAIAKYFSLVRLGFAARDLRIVIVSDSKAHDFHAVLVANISGADWLLDNQLPEMVRLESMPQYTPIYSLNQEGWWLHSQPVIQVAANVVITTTPITAAGPVPMRLATAN
jgi:predicted transglutaminase-like cysteine proteinase